MNNGIFSSLSQFYFQASKNVFYFVGHTSFLLKPFSFIFPIGIIFALFILLYHLGNFTVFLEVLLTVRN